MQRENRYSASTRYVWRQELGDILGEGAFGKVYKGVDKVTGEFVAVKTFLRQNNRSQSQMRELDILQRLEHPNIVRLITIEEVLGARRDVGVPGVDSMQGKVLIMELCTEESLYANLDRPENQFGLAESEFLLVLSHMTSGMRYLHENKIIHRDWKPSNILKTITSEGQTLYKLCDFGAARICDENEQFMSIVGTEEYLNPEIYRRALLGGSNGVFRATSDLWSAGVTMYQAATALLPFRPYGGRKNREMMNKLTSEKESGVISGYQDTENGPTIWRRELPTHCLLSSGLRPLITKLLAGLLESKPHLLWNYERYFHEVTKILSKVIIKFYVLGETVYRTVYLDRTADFFVFRDEISAQLGSSSGEFVLFFGGDLLDVDKWDMNDFLREQKSTIIVVPLDANNCQFRCLGIPLSPVFIEREPPALDWDADAAKTALSLAHWINVQMKTRQSICQSIAEAANEIKVKLSQDFSSINQQWSPWKHSWTISQKQLKFVDKLYSATERELLAPKHSSAFQIDQAMSSQGKEMLNLKASCMDFTKLHVPTVDLESEKRRTLAMEQTLSKMDTIYTQFRKDKALRMDQNPLTYNNELKWHGLQRKQLKTHWEFCKSKLDDAENDDFKTFIQNAVVYFNASAKLAKTLTKVEVGVRNMEEIIRAFGTSLDMLPTDSQSINATAVQAPIIQNGNVTLPEGSRAQAVATQNANPFQSLKVANSFLTVVKDIQDMRGVAQENRQLLERFPSTSMQ